MRPPALLVAVTALLVVVPTALAGSRGRTTGPSCMTHPVTPAYANQVRHALSAKQDVWGNALIARRNGPSYESVRRKLKPLLFARSPKGSLTSSGVYYLPFAQPLGVRGAETVALHVADGSEILSQRADGPTLRVFVGPNGGERYGSCLARLSPARLGDGYLPLLETQYADSSGARYQQESFSVRGLGTGKLVSFVRLTATAKTSPVTMRLVPVGSRRGVRVEQGTARYRVEPGQSLTTYAAWLVPTGGAPVEIDRSAYDLARQRLVSFWADRLGEQPVFDVPEKIVRDAERALLVQNLALTWRYSVGNQYEEFSFAEALDAAEVLGAYGLTGVTKEILRNALSRLGGETTNWRRGEKLSAAARYFKLTHDRAYVDGATPVLTRIVHRLEAQIRRKHGNGLLLKERFSSDIAARVYGLHAQAAVWQGLNAVADMWRATGRQTLARKARALAARLRGGLLRAVKKSERRLKDGSLFIPAALLANHRPFDSLTASRPGSYWNLVVPYALASGLFQPHGREATGVLDYMLGHGSRLLGLVRAGAYSLYGKGKYPLSGTDQVYGLNVARFLADNDRPDQLVLSLYGMLGASMTPNTFISGEAATVAPLRGASFRSMYLPPNTASNSAFLETLRLMLVHETRNADGKPVGLELAYSTPRPWLGDGKRIAVNEAPTSFGPVSFELRRSGERVTGTVTVPTRNPPRALRLRLRLPHGVRLGAVRVNGARRPVDRRTGSIGLSGLRGTLEVVAMLRTH